MGDRIVAQGAHFSQAAAVVKNDSGTSGLSDKQRVCWLHCELRI